MIRMVHFDGTQIKTNRRALTKRTRSREIMRRQFKNEPLRQTAASMTQQFPQIRLLNIQEAYQNMAI